MPISPELKRALHDRVRFYNDLGIYDFYVQPTTILKEAPMPVELPVALPSSTNVPAEALRLIREESETAPAANFICRDASRLFSALAIQTQI